MYQRFSTSRDSKAERAVTEVLGAILVFGLVLAVLALVQLSAVPAANEQVEFEHSQRVAADFQTLDENVEQVAISDTSKSTRVETGVRYPTRLFLVNPPAVGGSLQTEDGSSIVLRNLKAEDDEADDYWDGDERTRSSVSLRYEANYNEFESNPTIRYENGLLYRQFENSDDDVVVDAGSIISGRRINLLALEGSLSTSTADEMTLNANPISAPAQWISVTDNSDSSTDRPISITLSTRLSEEKWLAEVLSGEIDENIQALDDDPTCGEVVFAAGNSAPETNDDRYVVGCTYTPGNNGSPSTIEIILEQDVTYDLRMAKVGFGDEFSEEQAQYLTIVDGGESNIVDTQTQRLTVQVRDQFNNPVSGTPVTFAAVSGGTVSPSTDTSDESGHASTTFSPSSIGPKTVIASIGGSGEERKVEFTVSVRSPTGGTGFPDRLQDINTRDEAIYVKSVSWVSPTTWDVTFRNIDSEDRFLKTGRIPFVMGTNDPTNADISVDGVTYENLHVASATQSIGGADGILIGGSGGEETIRFTFDQNLKQTEDGNFDAMFIFTTGVYKAGQEEFLTQTFFLSDGLEAVEPSQANQVIFIGEDAQSPPGSTVDSAARFTIQNVGTQPATLASIQVVVVTGDANRLGETNPGTGAFNREVFVDTTTSGYADPTDGGNPNVLGNDVSFDVDPIIDSGESATLTLSEFRDNNTSIDVTGQEIQVQLTFSDGSTRTFTLTP